MKIQLLVGLAVVALLAAVLILFGNDVSAPDSAQETTSNQSSAMKLTLAAPRVDDTYYQDFYDQIVSYQIDYAKRIIAAGNDNVQILADAETIATYGDQLPDGTFIERPMLDIWMRDFTLVNPASPVQFTYTDASMTAAEAVATQQTFADYADAQNIQRSNTTLIIDGGNIVDDYSGRIITTTRFLEDNGLSMAEGKQQLRDVLGATDVAILEPDDEALAHSDGMVAWIDDKVLAVNDYSATDPEFHEIVMDELRASFSDVTFVMLPVVFDEQSGADPGIGSACGVNINLVYTPTTLYVPTFDAPHDAAALQVIRDNTSKQVVEIPSSGVCKFGGSARCTVWQQF